MAKAEKKASAVRVGTNMALGGAIAFLIVTWVAKPLGLPSPEGTEEALTAVCAGLLQWFNSLRA